MRAFNEQLVQNFSMASTTERRLELYQLLAAQPFQYVSMMPNMINQNCFAEHLHSLKVLTGKKRKEEKTNKIPRHLETTFSVDSRQRASERPSPRGAGFSMIPPRLCRWRCHIVSHLEGFVPLQCVLWHLTFSNSDSSSTE